MKNRIKLVVRKNSQNPKKSTPRRSAEGAEARDFFIPCGAFGAAGASKTRIQCKNTSTEEYHGPPPYNPTMGGANLTTSATTAQFYRQDAHPGT